MTIKENSYEIENLTIVRTVDGRIIGSLDDITTIINDEDTLSAGLRGACIETQFTRRARYIVERVNQDDPIARLIQDPVALKKISCPFVRKCIDCPLLRELK